MKLAQSEDHHPRGYCEMPTTGYAVTCGDPSRFYVFTQYRIGRACCTQHLGKAARLAFKQRLLPGSPHFRREVLVWLLEPGTGRALNDNPPNDTEGNQL